MKGVKVHSIAEGDAIVFDKPAIGLVVFGSILEDFLMH